MTANLEEYDEIKFLKYYFMCSPKNKIVKEKELPKYYEEYFNNFNDRNSLKEEIIKMIEYSKIYQTLFDKQEVSINDNGYIKNIKMINQVGQQACHSFLMDYLYNVSDINRLYYITAKIEKMMFRRIVSAKSNKQLDGIFKSMIGMRKLNSANKRYEYNDDELFGIIEEKTPYNLEFKRMLKDRKWEKDDITNYFLRKIEAFLSQEDLKPKRECHIECIIPNKYYNPWVERLGFDRNKDKAKYELLTGKLGNIIILDFDMKNEEKSIDFLDKLNIYSKCRFYIVEDFIKDDIKVWNEDEVDKRTEKLVNLALKIWCL